MTALIQAINDVVRYVPRWLLYPLGLYPAVRQFYLLSIWGLGPDPVVMVERVLGDYGLRFLVVALAITPIRFHLGISLIKYRRAFGLLAFYYVVMHVLIWIVLDFQFFWVEMLRDIVNRPYVTIGTIGFVAMLPLAVTANDRAIRRLGAAAWQKLHRLVWLAAAAGALHYLIVVRTVTAEPVVHAVLILVFFALRLHWGWKRARARRISARPA